MFAEDNTTLPIEPVPKLSFLDEVHNFITVDTKVNHYYTNMNENFFAAQNILDKSSDFSFTNAVSFQYPSISVRLFKYFYIEKSFFPDIVKNYNTLSSINNREINLVVYNYKHLTFTSNTYDYDYRSHAAFYGLYAWESEVKKIKNLTFSQEPNATSMVQTSFRQGLFMSQIWENMFNVIGMMTHSPYGRAFSKEIDKLPISFLHITLIPLVSADVYFTDITYSYQKNGVELSQEVAAGWGLNLSAGAYIFSFDLFRTHNFNVTFLSSIYFSLNQEFFDMTQGVRKGESLANISTGVTSQSYISLTF